MKILYFTDPHTNSKKFNGVGANGIPARIDDYLNTFKWIRDVAIQEQVTDIVCGGDVFENVNDAKEEYRNWPMYFNFTFSSFHMLSQVARLSIIGGGNHDKYDSIMNVLEPFEVFAKVYHNPSYVYYPEYGRRFVFMPFVRDIEKNDYEAMLNSQLDYVTPTLVFTHQGIKNDAFSHDKDAVDASIFSRDNIVRVFGGHYHHFFIINDKIVFPGSVMAFNFTDIYSEKQIIVYDVDSDTVTYHKNPYGGKFLSVNNLDLTQDYIDKLMQEKDKIFLRVLIKKDEKPNFQKELFELRGCDIKKVDMYKEEIKMSGKKPEEQDQIDARPVKPFTLSFTRDEFRSLVYDHFEDTSLLDKSKKYLDEIIEESFNIGS